MDESSRVAVKAGPWRSLGWPTGRSSARRPKPRFSRTVQIAHRDASADRPAIVAIRARIDEVFADLAPSGRAHHPAA